MLQGSDDMGLPPLTRDYSSLEIRVFTVQNINRFTPLVSVYTLHCSTAPRRENSQISLWILQDQSSWECLQAENVFAFSSPFPNCFWKCLKHKIAGKSKPLKELRGETLIYSNEKYWNIFLRIFSHFSLRNNMWQWLGMGDVGVWGAWILPSAGPVPGKLLCMSSCLLVPGGDDGGHLGELKG